MTLIEISPPPPPPPHTPTQLKTPMTLDHKKRKASEQLLEELNVPSRSIPTELICVQYNDLRYYILVFADLAN